MAKSLLISPNTDRAPRKSGPRASIPPRISIYGDGVARLSHAARQSIGDPSHVSILHDDENPQVIYVQAHGPKPQKLNQFGTFSAAHLHRHAGSPANPTHVDLALDHDGDLKGDLGTATTTQSRRRATVGTTDAAAATNGSHLPTAGGSVEGLRNHPLSGHDLPGASAPSVTSSDAEEFYPDEDEDDEEYEEIDDEDED